jgi:hypothetical protein
MPYTCDIIEKPNRLDCANDKYEIKSKTIQDDKHWARKDGGKHIATEYRDGWTE